MMNQKRIWNVFGTFFFPESSIFIFCFLFILYVTLQRFLRDLNSNYNNVCVSASAAPTSSPCLAKHERNSFFLDQGNFLHKRGAEQNKNKQNFLRGRNVEVATTMELMKTPFSVFSHLATSISAYIKNLFRFFSSLKKKWEIFFPLLRCRGWVARFPWCRWEISPPHTSRHSKNTSHIVFVWRKIVVLCIYGI